MASGIIDQLVSRIKSEVAKISDNYEIVLVEDGSTDNSWEEILNNCKNDPKVKGIKLSRNFGQHYALTAALEEASGEYVIVMDCDLQDNPKYIDELYKKAQEGYDVIYTKKQKRNHNFIKDMFARFWSAIFNTLSREVTYKDVVGSYSLLTRKAVNAFLSINEYHRHYLLLLNWVGLNHTYIEIEHEARFRGKSSYTFGKLVKHAINGIVSQSDRLLNLSIFIGFFFFIVSILGAGYLIIEYFRHGFQPGWPSIVVLIILSTGLILMSLGVLGLYLGKTFEQVKNRPLYIIDKRVNI